MEKIFVTFILLLSFALFHSQKKIREKHVVFSDAKYYYKKKIINGEFLIKFEKPKEIFSEKSYFSEGIKNGFSSIYRFGKLEENGKYNNNLREGLWFKYFHHNTEVVQISYYKKGKKEGLELKNNFSGSIDSLYYRNGELDGQSKIGGQYETYRSGKLVFREVKDKYNNPELQCKYTDKTSLCVRKQPSDEQVEGYVIIDSISKKDNFTEMKTFVNGNYHRKVTFFKEKLKDIYHYEIKIYNFDSLTKVYDLTSYDTENESFYFTQYNYRTYYSKEKKEFIDTDISECNLYQLKFCEDNYSAEFKVTYIKKNPAGNTTIETKQIERADFPYRCRCDKENFILD
ncbi:hypothetical protein [Chryseobacterium foetidum]|uniref:hypothetical protein n=1 Tax=Chryseobacterium foetidum TaxID=2951057 RepID=UPI0021C84A1C|nr:hypothetical protein [Chryseobacterium foetidum]